MIGHPPQETRDPRPCAERVLDPCAAGLPSVPDPTVSALGLGRGARVHSLPVLKRRG